jgi:hypothetical protein
MKYEKKREYVRILFLELKELLDCAAQAPCVTEKDKLDELYYLHSVEIYRKWQRLINRIKKATVID